MRTEVEVHYEARECSEMILTRYISLVSYVILYCFSSRLGEALEVHDEVGGHGPQGHGLGRPHVLLAEGRVPGAPFFVLSG